MSYEYPYEIFDAQMILEYQHRQQEVRMEQMRQEKNILDMIKAVSDYCSAARKAAPQYQQKAVEMVMAEILRQMAL